MTQSTSSSRRGVFALILGGAISLAACSRTPAAGPDSPAASGERPTPIPTVPGGSTNPDRLREGTKLLNEVGVFLRKGGDRYTFRANLGKREFACLENLNLERIAVTAADNPDVEWVVSGTVTEFRGTNCLLISQAMLKAKSSRIGQ